ncbi:hypothetical protein PR048_015623 [Dryococelus australis]|uniref:Uncharacterized protein n=1 Tax=Dryococelus australis TaxID=614101 RepID=A0ABQ9HHG8_9NEOP|nr:hypothetical protein PR048_015623 [Dryococelus australis]
MASGRSSLLKFVTKQNDSVIDAELLWANFVCENNLPIRLADSFTKLVPEMFPNSDIAKSFHCGRTKTWQIIRQAIAATAEKEIINTMRKSLFTLLINLQILQLPGQLASEVETHLFKVVAFGGKATRGNFFNVVNKSFEDLVTAMVQKLWSENLILLKGQQENLWFLHYTCHVAHLAASHACSEIPNVCEQLS